MFIKYIFGQGNLKRIKRAISLSVIQGLSREEAVLRGIKLADKIICRELDKHRRRLLRTIEYFLIKYYLIDKNRIEDPMEEFNGTQNNVGESSTTSISSLIHSDN